MGQRIEPRLDRYPLPYGWLRPFIGVRVRTEINKNLLGWPSSGEAYHKNVREEAAEE